MVVYILNLRYNRPEHPYDVRVDRTSILGNPFAMNKPERRDTVCDQYHKHFHRQRVANLSFLTELQRLEAILKEHGMIRLFCWCAPHRCHAETIKQYLEIKTDDC